MTADGAQAIDALGAILSQPTTSADYVATTLIDMSEMKPGMRVGLSAYNGREDAVGVMAGDGKIFVYARERKKHSVVKTVNAPAASLLYLRMSVKGGSHYRFAFSSDGSQWKTIEDEVNGSFMEGVRIALTIGGQRGATGKFEWLRVTPSR